jgi:condensin complex subunit 3
VFAVTFLALNSTRLQQTPFENAAVGKLFGRFKDRFSKLFANELKDIDPTQYLDQEFCDIYQQIGVEVPDAGSRQQKPSPARTATQGEEPGLEFPLNWHFWVLHFP